MVMMWTGGVEAERKCMKNCGEHVIRSRVMFESHKLKSSVFPLSLNTVKSLTKQHKYKQMWLSNVQIKLRKAQAQGTIPRGTYPVHITQCPPRGLYLTSDSWRFAHSSHNVQRTALTIQRHALNQFEVLHFVLY